MGGMASQITSLTIVYSTVYSSADQRKHQSSASMAFVGGIHRSPVNSPHKWTVTRKMFPFDDVFMETIYPFRHWNRNVVILMKISSNDTISVFVVAIPDCGVLLRSNAMVILRMGLINVWNWLQFTISHISADHVRSPGCMYMYMSSVWANERRRYIGNMFSYKLGPF